MPNNSLSSPSLSRNRTRPPHPHRPRLLNYPARHRRNFDHHPPRPYRVPHVRWGLLTPMVARSHPTERRVCEQCAPETMIQAASLARRLPKQKRKVAIRRTMNRRYGHPIRQAHAVVTRRNHKARAYSVQTEFAGIRSETIEIEIEVTRRQS